MDNPRRGPYHQCAVCGEPIAQKAVGRPRLTCSAACRQHLRQFRLAGLDLADPAHRVEAWEREFGPLTRTRRDWEGGTERARFLIWLQQGHMPPHCRHCRRPYGNRSEAPFCSQKCRRAHNRHRLRVRQALDHHHASVDPAIAARFDQRLPIDLCQRCGAPMSPRPHRRYCSDHCRVSAFREKRGTCPVCGTRFKQHKPGSKPLKYCSHRCGKQHWQQAKRAEHRAALTRPKPCAHCGTTFTPSGRYPGRQIYCSRQCADRASYHRRRGATTQGRPYIE